MRARAFAKESELGRPVTGWLEEHGWDVYQEVEAPGGRADLVGIRAPLVCVVEMKLSLGVDVLAQARNWLQYAHLVWVAVPKTHRDHSVRGLLFDYARWKGIGILTVDAYFVCEELEPGMRRRVLSRLRDALRQEHKTHAAAGSNRGGHWTPFKGTCDRLRSYVAAHPGATMKEVLASIEHHYANAASARANLVALIERGVIDGIRLERDGKAWRVFLKETR